MPLALGVLVDVFPREAAEEDAVEAGMESVQVGTTHVTDARLGLGERNIKQGICGERILHSGGGGEGGGVTRARRTEPHSQPAQVDPIKRSCNLERRMTGNHCRCLHMQALLK